MPIFEKLGPLSGDSFRSLIAGMSIKYLGIPRRNHHAD